MAEPPPPKSYAHLITPQTIQRFQHLRKHQGQLLLERENLHLIFAGIPPIDTDLAFSPLLAKVYKLQGKSWHAQAWLPLPEISIRTPEGERLALVGQDVEPAQSSQRIVSFYRSARAEARVYLSLVPPSSALEVEIRSSEGKPLLWDIRFSRGLGEEHSIPYGEETLAGLTIALLPDASSVVSSVPLKFSRDGTYQSIGTISPQQRSGFYVLLDRAGLAQQSRLVSHALACYEKANPTDQTSLDCLRGAWNSPPSYWTVHLPIKIPLRGERRLMQTLFIHSKKGAFRSVLPIFEGEQIKIARANIGPDNEKTELDLLVPDGEGVLQLQSLDESTDTILLNPLARGSLQLSLEPNEPSFVEIRDAVRSNGVAIQAWLSVKAADLFSPHTVLQRSWPLLTQIPAGDYHIQVFTGASVICQQRFTVRPDRLNQVRCHDESPQKKLSPRVSLSLDTSIHTPELLQAASMQVVARGDRKTSTADSLFLAEIPTIEVSDPDLGLSLRAFPADEALRNAWSNYKSLREGQKLQDFMTFIRAQGKGLLVVLECPASGFQLEEYEWLALTVAPDILEIFGCLQAEMSKKFLSIAQALQQKSAKPIKLAAASPLRSLSQIHGEVPAIYMPINPSQMPLEAALEALRNGFYSLGMRSEIEVDSKSVHSSSRLLALKVRSYDLKKRAGLIRVYDQDEMLSEYPLPPSTITEWDLKIPLRLSPRSRWLRIELLGLNGGSELMTASETDSRGTTFLLATTNFLGLDEAR